METSFITCVICPKGCSIKVCWNLLDDGSKNVVSVEGNSCPRGLGYATSEVVHPERVLTSTIRVVHSGENGSCVELVPIRSASPIPKESMMAAMDEISRTILKGRSLKMGDVVVGNVAGTGIDMVACRDSRLC